MVQSLSNGNILSCLSGNCIGDFVCYCGIGTGGSCGGSCSGSGSCGLSTLSCRLLSKESSGLVLKLKGSGTAEDSSGFKHLGLHVCVK